MEVYKIWDIIEDTFQEIREIYPFEILRNNRERGNYLVSHATRIIAMTSTHASMKRDSLVKNGFQYSTVLFEEAGEILEIESFISCNLQKTNFSTQQPQLKRIIMIGYL